MATTKRKVYMQCPEAKIPMTVILGVLKGQDGDTWSLTLVEGIFTDKDELEVVLRASEPRIVASASDKGFSAVWSRFMSLLGWYECYHKIGYAAFQVAKNEDLSVSINTVIGNLVEKSAGYDMTLKRP